MKKLPFYFYVLLLILFQQSILLPQYQSYKINPPGKSFFGESSLKINPKNTNQIVAGIMASYTPLTGIMGYCYSTNSGLTWGSAPMTCSFAQPGSDPIIIVDTLGNFYYICCANWGVSGPNLDKLLIFKSTNGGENWDGGTAFAQMAPQLDDMPNACMDMSHGQYGNNIYVTWSLYDGYPSNDPNDSCYVAFCRSTDGGVTFSNPIHISRVAGTSKVDNSSPEGVCPCTGPNSEVYAVWPLNEKVMFNRSTNAGVNWLQNDIYVCDQVGGWTGINYTSANWSPAASCDISESQYRGNIYICFADTKSGANDKDIWFVKSTNQGNNWSVPKRVNNDGAGNDQRLPWMCVDKATGYIWIFFYDSRYNALSMSNPFIARSTDGGDTFQNVRLSTLNLYNGFAFGEYMGLDAFDNKVRPLWSLPSANYNVQSYVTIIDTFYSVAINNVNGEIPSEFSLSQNYPNPFNPRTVISFQLPTVSDVMLKVYDATGKEIATLVNERLQPGTYETTFDGSGLNSGVYFYKLTTDGFSETKRMILLK